MLPPASNHSADMPDCACCFECRPASDSVVLLKVPNIVCVDPRPCNQQATQRFTCRTAPADCLLPAGLQVIVWCCSRCPTSCVSTRGRTTPTPLRRGRRPTQCSHVTLHLLLLPAGLQVTVSCCSKSPTSCNQRFRLCCCAACCRLVAAAVQAC
jgi:hypothetical protein